MSEAMKKRILYVALDACDPALAQRFAGEGKMPNLARLLEASSRAPVDNPHGLFVGALWANFGTALRPERHGFHCWDKIDPSSYEYLLNTPRIDRFEPFWCAIGKDGRKVCVIDVPHHRTSHPAHGVQVFEWGCHDKHFGLTTSPPELASEIEQRFGFHPALSGANPFEVRDCAPDDDIHRAGRFRTLKEDCALLQDLPGATGGA